MNEPKEEAMNEPKDTKKEPKEMTPAEVQDLMGQILLQLNAAGEKIVAEHVEKLGIDPFGVAWLLSQGCLSIAVASYFHAGRSPDELVAQIRQAWRQHQMIAMSTVPEGRA